MDSPRDMNMITSRRVFIEDIREGVVVYGGSFWRYVFLLRMLRLSCCFHPRILGQLSTSLYKGCLSQSAFKMVGLNLLLGNVRLLEIKVNKLGSYLIYLKSGGDVPTIDRRN